MNERDFQAAVIHGAEELLDMLASIEQKNPNLFHEKYLKIARVLKPLTNYKKKPRRFRLDVDDYTRDGAVLYVGDTAYPEVAIVKTIMTKTVKCVYIDLPDQYRFLFHNVDFRTISLRSDMRFLIQRLMRFHSEHEICFHPHPPLLLPPCEIKLNVELSDEQRAAIETVFSSPVSYVWGAPGTGKTNVVLASCILRYISAKKRVALLAPTNNSVEQVLRGILPTLKASGVDLLRVYRLGAASYEFTEQYPEVVGDRSLELHRQREGEAIIRLTNELEQSEQYEKAVTEVKERLANFDEASLHVSALLTQYHDAEKLFQTAHAAYQKAEENARKAIASHEALSEAFSAHLSLIQSYDQAIKETNMELKRTRFRFWKRKLCASLERSKQSVLKSYHDALNQSPEQLQALNEAEAKAKQAQKEAKASFEASRSASEACANMTDEIRRALRSHGLAQLCPVPISELEHRLSLFRAQLSQRCDDVTRQPCRNAAEITADLEEAKNSLSIIDSSAKATQLKNAYVVAATFDTILNQLPQTQDAEPFSHVFIDEAGYTSLARGSVAFSCGCPVSFFGDHFQLPPICEMQANKIPNHPPVVTWALPVIAYSDVLRGDLLQLLTIFKNNAAYSFDCLSVSYLYKTYRFSTELASILDQCVYHTNRFTGIDNAAFHITVLNCPKIKSRRRQSISEAENIVSYLKTHAFDREKNSFAVMAPYNAQIKLLKKKLPEMKDDILTIHRSQGMEWETVILSVCDTDDAYFVDSTLALGRNVLNTAISRTKRDLIIACDCDYWRTQPNQLIGKLVQTAIAAGYTPCGHCKP